MGFNWKCGQTKERWARVIGVIDMIKGSIGLIYSVYLCSTIIPWVIQTPDFLDLKQQVHDTAYVYIFAYGGTRLGIVIVLVGGVLWNFLLIVFGWVLIDGVRQTGTTKLRHWYIYTLLSNIAFFGFYFRLGQTLIEVWGELSTSRWAYSGEIILLIFYYIFIALIPTIFSLAIVRSVVLEIYEIQREEAPINSSRLRKPSIMPPPNNQDSRL